MADDPQVKTSIDPTQSKQDTTGAIGQAGVAVTQPQAQPQIVSGGPKEQVEMRPSGGERGTEKPVEAVQEIPTSVELEKKPELEGFAEQPGADMDIAGGVTDDYTQTVLLGYDKNGNAAQTLPLSEAQVQEGLHHKVWESIRWLAEWCVRQAKKLHGKVMYRK